MAIDLTSMSRKELEKLREDVDKTLATLDERKKAEALKAAEEAAKKHGFSLGDLMGKSGARTKKQSGAPKYRNPADPKQTWTGRGRQPAWIKDGLAAGRPLEDFAI